ncbi:MAG: sigma-70 family RNA polymerase sigma factor [Candidatus Paceibacterota bacterium]
METITQETNIEEILTQAYKDYRKPLLARAMFKVSDPVICEELVQDTFMKVWAYLAKGGEVATMRAFLYHVLNNLIVDQYRKHKTVSLDNLLEKGYEPSESNSATSSADRMIDSIDGKAVLPLIEQLPKKYQNVMIMRYTQDLSLEEMSKITGESKQTIAVQAHRGLEKLKQMCKPEMFSYSSQAMAA